MHGEHAWTGPREKTVPRNRVARLPSARPTEHVVPRHRFLFSLLSLPAQPGRRAVPRNRSGLVPAGRAWALIGSALLVFAITACTGDPAPVGTLPDSSPTSLTASPTITEPVRPIDKATPESAIQFTRYFWDLYNYAYQTYDTAPLNAVARSTCSFCSTITQDVKRIATANTRIDGHAISVIEATSPPVKIKSGTLTVATIEQDSGTAVGSNGKTTNLEGFANRRSTISLTWDGQWSVDAVSISSAKG